MEQQLGRLPLRYVAPFPLCIFVTLYTGTGAGSYVCNPGSGFTCGGIRLVFDQPLIEASSYGDINSYHNGFVLWDEALKNFQPASLTSVADDGLTLQVFAAAAACCLVGAHDFKRHLCS